jgi:hypothetical protein
MNKSGWVKILVDGTVEEGWDELVRERKASWTKGNQDEIVGVELHVKGACPFEFIAGHGQWWQSDKYESSMLLGRPQKATLKERRVFYKLEERHIGHMLQLVNGPHSPYDSSSPFAKWALSPEKINENNGVTTWAVKEENVGKWLKFTLRPNSEFTVSIDLVDER